MDQLLEQPLPLAPRRDDLLGLAIVDPLIFERTRYVISYTANVRLQVERRRYKMHRARLNRLVRTVIADMLGDESESCVQRMESIESVRAAFGLFLHPLDQ